MRVQHLKICYLHPAFAAKFSQFLLKRSGRSAKNCRRLTAKIRANPPHSEILNRLRADGGSVADYIFEQSGNVRHIGVSVTVYIGVSRVAVVYDQI